jgi:UDP-hydrolysing UDP-N-acetyl-D-glucosamine 2-epimerase
MSKRKICVVITARPTYSRVKTVLKAIKENPRLELQLVVSSSALLDRYGSVVNHIEQDGFEIAAKVFNVLEGENLTAAAKTTGIGILELSTVLDTLKPDIAVTVADRFETIATAISASFMNIPLAHIQGGEVTGNIDEKVRHSITKLSDYHFVASEESRRRVIRLGEDPEFVFNTGCPSIDIAAEVLKSPEMGFDPYKKYGGVGNEPDLSDGYIVVLQHPVTNEYSESRKHVEETLIAVRDLKVPVLWFWPNVDAGSDGTSAGIRAFREMNKPINMHFFKNMEGMDFLRLLINSKCIVGNSSVGIRECAYLGIPAINIGSRQNRRERGENTIDVAYSKKDIHDAILKCLSNGKANQSSIYGDGSSGKKIADILVKLPLKFHKTLTF